MISPWDRWYSTSCCLCCHVRTGTIILGIWYMLINAVVLLILLSALNDPIQYRYHLTSSELGTDIDVMDDANICIATAISLLMILICGMATYGAYKQHAAWIIPFFCYQIFDFALNTLVAISVVVYPNTVQDYLQQLPGTFPYKEDIMSTNNMCLVFAVLLFIGCILSFKAYLIGCVWNCYRYVSGRGTTEVLVYVTTNDTTFNELIPLNVQGSAATIRGSHCHSTQGASSPIYGGVRYILTAGPYTPNTPLPPQTPPTSLSNSRTLETGWDMLKNQEKAMS
ncbi:lysosomal-associated transmembrane protein 4B-like isoform X1 [Seriola dumerili]|uniref:lysosomal-associated transmembrane protein 4B-like isoform X1 n=1 Tax=Seriola dumerili TaxID=41447 RepID=UPI000BBE7708|nr:lysosomal-associated transmembrane protein 4B-like isoform X1 [Seriola dumerili]